MVVVRLSPAGEVVGQGGEEGSATASLSPRFLFSLDPVNLEGLWAGGAWAVPAAAALQLWAGPSFNKEWRSELSCGSVLLLPLPTHPCQEAAQGLRPTSLSADAVGIF